MFKILWELAQSETVTAGDVARAGLIRSAWFRYLHNLFQTHDFLVLPTAQVFPFAASTHWPDQIAGVEMDTYHRWMEVVIGGSMAGCPCISLPAGFNNGRPMGLQVIAPYGEDAALLEFALSYEAALPWHEHYDLA